MESVGMRKYDSHEKIPRGWDNLLMPKNSTTQIAYAKKSKNWIAYAKKHIFNCKLLFI